jgi:nicotinic acid mononucleotide adenylyltransferase
MNDSPISPTIALFGGGFKPPTKGHLEVVLQGIEQNPNIDKIYIAALLLVLHLNFIKNI